MKKKYFTPGPSQVYPTVIKYFGTAFKNDIASISHRGKEFQKIYQDLTTGLKKLLNIPEDYHIFIVGSGTEAMERTIQNCVSKYSFHFVNGSFSKRFFATAQELGKHPIAVETSFGEGFSFQEVPILQKTELICFTHNETSTGVMLPAGEIKRVAQKYPEMLVAVDIVSSAPYANLDYKFLDVAFFSVQKLFGLPAGIGIMIVSPRAIKKAQSLLQKGTNIGSYHSFPSLMKFAEKFQTPETPPVIEMYVLGKAIEDMLAIGIYTIRKETEQKAKLLYDFLDSSDTFSTFVKEKQFRSQTVVVADVQKTKKDIKKILSQKGMIVGSGYGEFKEKHIRIANFPTHSIRDAKQLLRELKNL
jgi:phosphoserine aminotransferase